MSAAHGGTGEGYDGDWLAYGADDQLTNFVPAPPGRPPLPQGLEWMSQLDGAVYASPLAAGAVATPSGVRDLVIAETEAGTVYALDAADGSVVWQRSFPTETTRGCGNWGLTSTGAIDKQRGLLYLATARGFLHALQLASGSDAGGWPTRITNRPLAEYIWGGLRILGSRVYVPVASYCDIPDPTQGLAEGRLVGVAEDDATDQVEFDPVPGGNNLGGIWGVSAVSSDASGDVIYTAVGNSAVQDPSCNCTVETSGYGDEVVALAPDLSQVIAADRPPYIPTVGDADFGASPLVFQPAGCPPLLAANNKNGNLFIWNSHKLASGPIARFGIADSVAPFVAQPAWNPQTQMLYDSHAVVRKNGKTTGQGIAGIAVTPGCKFAQTWLTQTGTGLQMPPLLVGNVVYDGAGDAPALVALDAHTGKVVWRWQAAGTAGMTAPLIEADGLVIAADTAGAIRAFQLG